MEKEALISVITTIYNTEDLFDRCYKSILEQTYKSIQFIIVNNGSKGDIDKNIEKYLSNYNNFEIKYIKLEENIGLYHARLKGSEVATGDYIAFLDSDDRVSVDYYRMMVTRAKESNYDIVISDFAYEDEKQELMYDIYNYIQGYEFELNGKEIFDIFYKQEAHSFFWNLIWNKIYSMDLWNKVKPYLYRNTNKIVMCDDIIFTFILFYHAKKLLKIKNNYYYYYKHSTANSNPISVLKTNSILNDIINVFYYCELFLKEVNCDIINIKEWKKRYARMWGNFIKYSKFSFIDKYKLINKLEKELVDSDELDFEKIQDDMICVKDSNRIKFNDDLETIKKQLLNNQIKVVSFDIFDTLLVRHVWEPHDLFYFLDQKFIDLLNVNINIEFHKIRSYCEHLARERAHLHGLDEITLDDIYEEINLQYGYDKEILKIIKEYEMDLELQLCKKRDMLYDIYEMCMYIGKEVIYISDMYLPEEFIYKMLEKNKYSINNTLFMSSTHKITKRSSKLYSYVLEEKKILNKEIIHIGDNLESDVMMANSVGIKGIHIPRTIDAYTFLDKEKNNVRKEFIDMYYDNNFIRNLTLFSNIGSRCLMALAINKYMDNPYIFVKNSYSGMNLYFIGYHILGTYVFAASNWIKSITYKEKYNSIVFLSRDGYIIKKAFDILYSEFDTNYFYASRRSLLALSIKSKEDILGLSSYVYFMDYSPKKLINIFCNSLKYEYKINVDICEKQGFKVNNNFISKEQFDKFLLFFKNNLFCDKKNIEYINKMKKLFATYFKKNSVTFDIGYSGRTESILNNLLGYKIDALYLYKNYNRSEINSKMHKFNIHKLYDYFPNINEEILLELFISEIGHSCKYYEVENNKLKFVFNNEITHPYMTNYFMNIIQQGSIDFINDVNTYFKSLLCQNFYYNEKDLAYLLHYYIYKVPIEEFSYLESAIFDDSINYNNIISINDVLKYVRGNLSSDNYSNPISYIINSEKNRFKRIIYYILFDRNTLKFKVNNKTKKYYILNSGIKLLYKSIRKVYHLLLGKK